MVCLENGLSVIVPKTYRERMRRTDYSIRNSYREKICIAIDFALQKNPRNFNEFIQLMSDEGYEFKNGKSLSIRGKGQKRFIRFKSLKDGYTVSDIKERIIGDKSKILKKKTGSLIC